MSQIYQKERINYIKTMKKIIALFVLATLFVASNAIAQTQLVATLKHGDTTRLFYGGTALQQAHDAAEDGDMITLSSGTFNALTMNKAITISGVGMGRQGAELLDSTVIRGQIVVEEMADPTKKIIFEGLQLDSYFNLGVVKNFECRKCRLSYCSPFGGTIGDGSRLTFIGCRINEFMCSNECELSFLNCIVNNPYPDNDASSFNFQNCIVIMPHNRYEWTTSGMKYSVFNNCVLFAAKADYGKTLPQTSTVTNCVALHPEILTDNSTISNTTRDFSGFFKTYTQEENTNGDEIRFDMFELTDEAAATYLGDDGKQVGIYGGDFPFTTTLSYPQATSVNVAKTTVDGKLAVDIKFNGAE